MYNLVILNAGTGLGTVTSDPIGITCGSDCSKNYSSGTSVTLTAVADASSTFTGWSGACTNATGTCTVTMDASKNVTATFADTTPPVASTSGNPSSPTSSTSAAFTVSGMDVVAYKYKLDNGTYSAEMNPSTPISLSSLTEGSHTISIIGKDAAGNWQSDGSATTYTWIVNSNYGKDAWTQKKDFGGTGRHNAVGFSIGSKGYIGTGNDSYGTSLTKDFWEYDPVADTWKQMADFGGTARAAAVGFSIGSKGYIGMGYDDSSAVKDFWEFDPIANTWAPKADFGGSARSNAVGFAIGNKGYMGTGYDGSLTKDFWEYNPVADTWTQRADFGRTPGANGTVGFSIGSKGYIGTGSDGSAIKNDFWEYDPVADTWTQKADFGGTGRGNGVGFSIGSRGYIGTGSYNAPQYRDFWEYNPGTPRFVVGSGTDADCVLDTQTNLMWAKNADLSYTTWQGALDWAGSLNLCGYTDWRVPEKTELEGLISGRQGTPQTWLNSQGFTNVWSGYYWSSTTYTTTPGYTNYAWVVYMLDGLVDANGKSYDYHVWPVRSRQSGSLYNLVISNLGSGSGTVTSNPAGINCGSDCSKNYTSGTSVTLTAAADAGSTFTGWSRDCSGNQTTCTVSMDVSKNVTATFALSDITAPTGTISINSDAAYTNSLAVTLTLSCTDASGNCTRMSFSNDASANWSTAEDYATTKSWNLLSPDGAKRVYVKFSDIAGNWSQPYNTIIVLDTSAPVTIPSTQGGTYISAQTVTLSAGEGSTIYYTLDGSIPTTQSLIYSITPITISSSTTLKYFAVDPAGNTESVKTATYTISAASGSAVNLPKTGQTKCYNATGAEITCTGTGQDGEIQAGAAWPSPRFTSGTGAEADCMLDNLTGLMWPKNGNLSNGTKTWNDAIDYPKTLTLCGHSDWRLPNINELESFVNASQTDSAVWLNTQGFTSVQSGNYWSSTTAAYYTDHAWLVHVWIGVVSGYPKVNNYYVWPVRSGQSGSFGYSAIWQSGQTISYRSGDDGDLKQGVSWPSPRFIDHNNGEVTDNLTGLIWTKDTNVPGPSACSPAAAKTWQGALDYVKCLNVEKYLGHTDWRLPSRKEFRSLMDYSKDQPVLLSGNPFSNVQSSSYWSSTTNTYGAGNAWVADMWNGFLGSNGKDSPYGRVWPVRTGQSGSSYNLVISNAGTGSGTVTSSPAGINCGSDCSENYSSGTSVTLTAAADASSTFAGWSGDCSGNQTTCTITMDSSKNVTATFGTSTQSYILSLLSGWNLISLPLQPTDTVITAVLNGISTNYSIVWAYDATNGWKKYQPGKPSDLTTMEAGNGYWIKMTAEKNLTIAGTLASQPAIQLKTGWNLVGWNKTTPTSVATALINISGGTSIVWAYDALAGWKKYQPSKPSDLSDFTSGLGFWIKVTGDVEWSQ